MFILTFSCLSYESMACLFLNYHPFSIDMMTFQSLPIVKEIENGNEVHLVIEAILKKNSSDKLLFNYFSAMREIHIKQDLEHIKFNRSFPSYLQQITLMTTHPPLHRRC